MIYLIIILSIIAITEFIYILRLKYLLKLSIGQTLLPLYRRVFPTVVANDLITPQTLTDNVNLSKAIRYRYEPKDKQSD